MNCTLKADFDVKLWMNENYSQSTAKLLEHDWDSSLGISKNKVNVKNNRKIVIIENTILSYYFQKHL